MSYQAKLVKVITPIALAISLAACGGDGSFGTKGGGTTPTATEVSSIQLSSGAILNSGGLEPLILTAIARDGSEALSGIDVNFNVYSDSGATSIDPFATISNKSSSGSSVTAELVPGSPVNRIMYVRATSNNILSNIKGVNVIGTTVAIDGSDAIAFGTSSEYIIKLKDSGNKAIAGGQAVVITSANGNSIDAGNSITDENGEIAFTLSGSQLGQDTITATALGAVATKSVAVSGDEFSLNSNNPEININTNETISFSWKKDNVVQASKPITISATRGTILPSTNLVTDSNGQVSFTISSATAGLTSITATSSVGGLSTTIEREFVATTPAYLNTQAEPATIVPNGSSTITSRVTDIDGNPVKNMTIDFNLSDTVNGSLSASTAVTDSLGRASVSYTAGNSTSAKDGVVITTFIQGYSLVSSDSVNLTVGGDALRISLGADHLISVEDVYYTKQIGVLVSDSAGNPVKNTKVTFAVKPTHYYKGRMYTFDTDGDGEADEWQQRGPIDLAEKDINGYILDIYGNYTFDDIGTPEESAQWEEDASQNVWKTLPTVECVAEDTNNNGILEAGEDKNNNGKLEPTTDATISVSNAGFTDDTGALVVIIKYLKNRALWSNQTVTAKISGVGTEYTEEISFVLPILTADTSNVESDVPNRVSPYGVTSLCTDPE